MTKDNLNDHLSPQQKGDIDTELVKLEEAGLVVKTKQNKAGAGRPATVWQLAKR
jgi:predicted ArsR family transcriptional regulator